MSFEWWNLPAVVGKEKPSVPTRLLCKLDDTRNRDGYHDGKLVLYRRRGRICEVQRRAVIGLWTRKPTTKEFKTAKAADAWMEARCGAMLRRGYTEVLRPEDEEIRGHP